VPCSQLNYRALRGAVQGLGWERSISAPLLRAADRSQSSESECSLAPRSAGARSIRCSPLQSGERPSRHPEMGTLLRASPLRRTGPGKVEDFSPTPATHPGSDVWSVNDQPVAPGVRNRGVRNWGSDCEVWPKSWELRLALHPLPPVGFELHGDPSLGIIWGWISWVCGGGRGPPPSLPEAALSLMAPVLQESRPAGGLILNFPLPGWAFFVKLLCLVMGLGRGQSIPGGSFDAVCVTHQPDAAALPPMGQVRKTHIWRKVSPSIFPSWVSLSLESH
jgi:hypothetical protein